MFQFSRVPRNRPGKQTFDELFGDDIDPLPLPSFPGSGYFGSERVAYPQYKLPVASNRPSTPSIDEALSSNKADITLEDASCPVCLEDFGSSVEPVVLKCSHNICLKCAIQMVNCHRLRRVQLSGQCDAASEVKCPLCMEATRTDASKKDGGFQKNFPLMNIVSQLASESKKCGSCAQKSADSDCLDCRASFCSDCMERLHSIPAFRSHQKTAVGTNRNRKKIEICKKHKKTMDFFCMDEGELVCSDCARAKQHQAHNCLPLADAVEDMEEFANELASENRQQEKLLQELKARASGEHSKLEQTRSTLVQSVNRGIDDLIQGLNRRREYLLKQVESSLQNRDTIHILQMDTSDHLLQRFGQIFAAKAEASAEPFGFLRWVTDMQKILDDVDDSSMLWRSPPPVTASLYNTDQLSLQIGSLGAIDVGRPIVQYGCLVNASVAKDLVAFGSLKNKVLSLVLRASRDGFDTGAFHRICDDYKQTWIVIKTADNCVIGGYTRLPWGGKDGFCADQNSCVFRVPSQAGSFSSWFLSGVQKYQPVNETPGIVRRTGAGPAFGSVRKNQSNGYGAMYDNNVTYFSIDFEKRVCNMNPEAASFFSQIPAGANQTGSNWRSNNSLTSVAIVEVEVFIGVFASSESHLLPGHKSSLSLAAHSKWQLSNAVPSQKTASRPVFKLVYKSSTHGTTGETLKRLCSNQPRLLWVAFLLCGRIFGGYTGVGWNFAGSNRDDADAFLFQLTNHDAKSVTKIQLSQKQPVTCSLASGQVTWGPGHEPDLTFWFSESLIACSTSKLLQAALGTDDSRIYVDEVEVYHA